MDTCVKCNRPVEFDSPEPMCRFCWVDWWYEPQKSYLSRTSLRKEKKKALQKIIDETKNLDQPRILKPPHEPINPQGSGLERYKAALAKYERKTGSR